MDIETKIRAFIKSRRISMGLSQRDMADLMLIDERNYARLERGERKGLEVHLLKRIAIALKVPLVEIIMATDESDRDSKDSHQSDFQDFVVEKIKEIAHTQQQISDNTKILIETQFRK